MKNRVAAIKEYRGLLVQKDYEFTKSAKRSESSFVFSDDMVKKISFLCLVLTDMIQGRTLA